MCDPTPKAVLLLPIFSMWEVEEGDGGGGVGGERDLKTTTVSKVSKANQCGGIQWASSFITYFFPALHQWTLALHHGPHTCNQL